MGVIKREGIKKSVVTYIGVLLGAVNTMYFYPKFFTEENLGLFRFLIDTSTLIYPFVSLGIHNLSVRMFPTFKNPENGHNGLWFFLLSGVTLGFLFFFILAMVFNPLLAGIFDSRSIIIQNYWEYIIPLAGLSVLIMISNQYILNFKKLLFPSVVNELSLKLGLPLIAVLTYFDYMTLLQGVYFLLIIHIVMALALMAYIVYLKEWHFKPNWKFITKPLRMEMREYALYGILGSLGSMMANRIDIFMIAMLAADDLKDVGVYTIAFFIANVITVPARAINNISSPVIAESWKANDMDNLRSVYSKSSLVLLTIGILFLIGIWSSIDDLFALMPNGENFAVGKYVILILGLGKLFDLATGNNGEIIAYSKYFKFNFYAVLILAVLNVVNNYIFIPIYQINGAALATSTSIFFYNLSKTVFVNYKIGLQPFSLNSIKVLTIGVIVYLIATFIPSVGMPLVDILVRSAVITVLYVGSVLYFKISPDLQELFWQVMDKVNVFKKK